MTNNFWDLGDGTSALDVGPTYESAGGSFIIIPDRSNLKVLIKDAGREKDKEGREYIYVTFTAIKPEEVKGFQIKKKFWLLPGNPDPNAKGAEEQKEKRKKNLKMFGSISHVNNKKISRVEGVPTDSDLKICLINGEIVIGIGKMDDSEGKPFNFVRDIFEVTKEIKLSGPVEQKAPSTTKPADDWGSPSGGGFGDANVSNWGDDLDDSIPF